MIIFLIEPFNHNDEMGRCIFSTITTSLVKIFGGSSTSKGKVIDIDESILKKLFWSTYIIFPNP